MLTGAEALVVLAVINSWSLTLALVEVGVRVDARDLQTAAAAPHVVDTFAGIIRSLVVVCFLHVDRRVGASLHEDVALSMPSLRLSKGCDCVSTHIPAVVDEPSRIDPSHVADIMLFHGRTDVVVAEPAADLLGRIHASSVTVLRIEPDKWLAVHAWRLIASEGRPD